METDKQKGHYSQYSLGTGTEMIQNAEDWGPKELGKSHENMGHFGKGPKNWRGVDEVIREEACESLYESYRVDATDIEVLVKDREIILNGFVTSLEEKEEAERCLDHIHRVITIYNNLVIHPRKSNSLLGVDSGGGMI